MSPPVLREVSNMPEIGDQLMAELRLCPSLCSLAQYFSQALYIDPFGFIFPNKCKPLWQLSKSYICVLPILGYKNVKRKLGNQ